MSNSFPRKIVEETMEIDTVNLRKWGAFEQSPAWRLLSWTYPSGQSVKMRAFVDEQNKGLTLYYEKDSFTIELTKTPCHFGGVRYWLKCPCCSKKMRVLYIGREGIACRTCHNLCYRSQNVGGVLKQFGRILFQPELDVMQKNIKKRHYRGFFTKKYQRYLREQERTDRAMEMALKML